MEPFIGQLCLFPYNFAPRNWAFCDGQLLPISQYSALFSLLGTTYGGDGRTTFGLPDLRGRSPIHMGTGPGLPTYRLGQTGGRPTVTLATNEIPSHSHLLYATSGSPDNTSPNNALIATQTVGPAYNTANNPDVAMRATAIGNSGGNQPHENMPPYLAMSWCIALQGIYPSRS